MKRIVFGIAVVVALALPCTATASTAPEARAVLRVAKQAERDWLAHRTEASCSHYTGAAKRKLVTEMGFSVTCEGTLKVVFDLMGPDDARRVRRTLHSLGIGDIATHSRRATVRLSGGHALRFERIAGRWYISDPNT